MCLSTVYRMANDAAEPEKLCSNVSSAVTDGDELTFMDILGSKTVVKGTIKQIDLVSAKIYVEPLAS